MGGDSVEGDPTKWGMAVVGVVVLLVSLLLLLLLLLLAPHPSGGGVADGSISLLVLTCFDSHPCALRCDQKRCCRLGVEVVREKSSGSGACVQGFCFLIA